MEDARTEAHVEPDGPTIALAHQLPSGFTNTTRDIDFNAIHRDPVHHGREEDPFARTERTIDVHEFAVDEVAFLSTAPLPERAAGESSPAPFPQLDAGVVLPGHAPAAPDFWAEISGAPEPSTELSFGVGDGTDAARQQPALSDGENRTPSPGEGDQDRLSSNQRSGPGPSGRSTGGGVPVFARPLPDQTMGLARMFPVGFFSKVREDKSRQNMRNIKAQMDGMKGALAETWERQRIENAVVLGRPMDQAMADADAALGTLPASNFFAPALQRDAFDPHNPVPLTLRKVVGAPIGSLGTSVFRGVQAAAEATTERRIDFDAPQNARNTLRPGATVGSRLLPEEGVTPSVASQTRARAGPAKDPLPPVVLQKRPSTAGGNDGAASARMYGNATASTTAGADPGAAAQRRDGSQTSRAPREVDYSHVDPLKWVKKLVTYTETHPIYIPEARAAGGAIEVTKDMQFRTTVFPNLKPSRREDAALLQSWLADLLSSLSATVKDRVVPPGANLDDLTQGTPEAAADAAMWVYTVAFEELKRQVQMQCREKAEMLQLLWGHFFTLVELRCSTRYEREIQEAAEQRDAVLQRLSSAHEALVVKEQDKVEIQRDKEDEIRTERMTSKALAQRYAHVQAELDAMAAKVVQAERQARDEIERRLATDADVAAWRKKNAILKQQVAVANQMIQEQHEAMERMHATRTELTQHIADMAVQAEAKNKVIEETSNSLENEKIKVEDLEQLLAKAQAASERREKELIETRALTAELESEIDSLRRTLEAVEKRAAAEAESAQRAAERLQVKSDEMSQVNLMFARLRKDHQQLTEAHRATQLASESQAASLEGELDETKRLLDRCRRDLERTTDQFEAAVKENDTLKHAVKENEHEFKQLKPLIKRLQFSIETMSGSLAEVRDLALLREEAWDVCGIQGRRQVTLSAISVATDSIIEELRMYRVENSNLRDKLESVDKIRKRVDTQVLDAKTAMEKALAEKMSMQKDRDKAQSERERLKQLVKDLETQNNDLRLKCEDFEGIMRQKDSDLAKLKRRMENLNQTEGDLKLTNEQLDNVRKDLYETQARMLQLEDEISEQKATNMDFLKHKIELELKQTEFEKNFNKNLQEMTTLRTAINVRDSRIRQAIEYLTQLGDRISKLKDKNLRLGRAVGLLQERLAHAETSRSVAAFIWPELTRFGLKLDAAVSQIAERYGTQTMLEHRAEVRREIEGPIMRILESTDLLPDNFVPMDDETFWADVLKPIEPPPMPSSTLFSMLRAMVLANTAAEAVAEPAKEKKKKSKKKKDNDESAALASLDSAAALPTTSATENVAEAEANAIAAAMVSQLPTEFPPTLFAAAADSYVATIADTIPLNVLEHVESEEAGKRVPSGVPGAAPSSDAQASSAAPARPWYDEVKWLKVQRGLLTKMLKSLRKHFAAEVKARQNLELQLLNQEARAVSQQTQMHMDFERAMEDFNFELRSMFAIVTSLRKSAVELKESTQLTRGMLVEEQHVRRVAETTITQLAAIEETQKQMVSREVQVDDPDKERWTLVVEDHQESEALAAADPLPGDASGSALKYHIRYMAEDALVAFIYDIMRVGMERWKAKAGKFSAGETVFDHIEYHASIKGVDKAASAAAATISQALRSCKRILGGAEANAPPRVRMFARVISAVGPEEAYDQSTYWFLLSVCSMVRNLMGLNWKLFEKDWSKGLSPLPLACADDVVANLFNTALPSALPFYEKTLMSFVHESPQGLVIDFDTLLEILCAEHNAGRCPVNPFVVPRKIVAGAAMMASAAGRPEFDPISGMVKDAPQATVRMMGGDAEGLGAGIGTGLQRIRRSSVADGNNPFPFAPNMRRTSAVTNEPPPGTVPVATFSRVPAAGTAQIAGRNFRRISQATGGGSIPSVASTSETPVSESSAPTVPAPGAPGPPGLPGSAVVKGAPSSTPSRAVLTNIKSMRSGVRSPLNPGKSEAHAQAQDGKEFQLDRGSMPMMHDIPTKLSEDVSPSNP